MKTFRIIAYAFFDAEDPQDAFIKLSDHFKALAETHSDSKSIIKAGVIRITTISDDDNLDLTNLI